MQHRPNTNHFSYECRWSKSHYLRLILFPRNQIGGGIFCFCGKKFAYQTWVRRSKFVTFSEKKFGTFRCYLAIANKARLKTFQSISNPRRILTEFWLNFDWILTEIWLNFDGIFDFILLHFDCLLAAFWLRFDCILTKLDQNRVKNA